ncbi:hypothetical protein BCV72DRAFT_307966 [Rhizopus microsporus var. microsporus]|uniref:Uncharacterized protein n=2 Tax=Rhizopus microsporus TaxID=58291 RepID=A0A2G4T323_RHIZD|nr:uncharacterized protein RHIMIDRAFT_234759 [Rhizopus microsporus ATCC 52813]ORE03740.1 hypothetical protein BCV72DRAFT_307966 [Rhizopus microsporus var. microsporus]PHZ15409.1 hypothetical protein RHIMIDRAFT_234759 [Rhizopus microsporus ATCC 52813]
MKIGLVELLLLLFFPCTYCETKEAMLLSLLVFAYFHEAIKLISQKHEKAQGGASSQAPNKQSSHVDQHMQLKLDTISQEMTCIKETMKEHIAYMKQVVDQERANKETAHAREIVNRDIARIKHMLQEAMVNQELGHQNIVSIDISLKHMVGTRLASVQDKISRLEKSINQVQEQKQAKAKVVELSNEPESPSLPAPRPAIVKEHPNDPLDSLPRPPSTDSINSDPFEIVDK